LLPLLGDINNYRSVQDEAAISFGIELLEENKLLARSVQPYYHARMAAHAMERAKELVNMEGLHVIEHLLLRKEKGAGKDIPVCGAGENPKLTVKTENADPVDLQPGADPYSFVMTVLLPAWPERFRKKENRQLLERMMQRETPAHILPRILWLTPMDMCTIESSYKKWLHWLKDEKHCGDFNPDELIGLLFQTQPDCLWDTPCGKEAKLERADEWLSQINRLYCWSDSQCADTLEWGQGGDVPPPGPRKSPFIMSGMQLDRPALKNPVVEKKPEKVRKADTREPHQRSAPQGEQEPKSLWKKGLDFVEKLGGKVAKEVGKAVEWAMGLIRPKM
jgi:hypothetical protein